MSCLGMGGEPPSGGARPSSNGWGARPIWDLGVHAQIRASVCILSNISHPDLFSGLGH